MKYILISTFIIIALVSLLIWLEGQRNKKYKEDKAMLDVYRAEIDSSNTVIQLEHLREHLIVKTTMESYKRRFYTVHSSLIRETSDLFLTIKVKIDTINTLTKTK